MIGEEYFNQTITWKSVSGTNDSNENTYTTTSIKARYEYKRKVTRNSAGIEVLSVAQCYTKYPIAENDVITFDSVDWKVVSVANQVDFFGNVNHYEVMV